MELTHLRYFVMLASVLNFTEAARRLFITQSTLSQSIRHTEEYLGVQLFERIGKKVYLTDAGSAFLPYAQKVMDEAEKGVQRIRDLQGINTGILKIGVLSGLRTMLIQSLSVFTYRYPDIRLQLHHSSSARELASMVLEDKVDMALTFLPGDISPLLESHVLFQSELKIMIAKCNNQNDSSMSLKDMECKPIVLPPMGTYIRTVIEELAMRYKLDLKPNAETNDSTLLVQLVKTGNWISIGTSTSIMQYPDLSAISIDEPTPQFTAAILLRKTGYHNKATQNLIELISGTAKD
jgi:transcriptional regulator, lysR family protein